MQHRPNEESDKKYKRLRRKRGRKIKPNLQYHNLRSSKAYKQTQMN